MKIVLASIGAGRSRLKAGPADPVFQEYLQRAARYTPCESVVYESEAALLAAVDRNAARSPATLILLDSEGGLLTSGQIASYLGRLRDSGSQRVVMAIGPADGWSSAARKEADLLVSFGRITLPHSLARVVLAEQVYRALSILAGHPYHTGH